MVCYCFIRGMADNSYNGCDSATLREKYRGIFEIIMSTYTINERRFHSHNTYKPNALNPLTVTSLWGCSFFSAGRILLQSSKLTVKINTYPSLLHFELGKSTVFTRRYHVTFLQETYAVFPLGCLDLPYRLRVKSLFSPLGLYLP